MRASRTLTVVGCHVGGEQNDVITGGVLPPPGASVFEQSRYLAAHDDRLRRMLLREPRGKPNLCVNLLVPPCDPAAAAGFIIIEAADYPAMSGSNTIAAATVLLETGMIAMTQPRTRLVLEAPAGLVAVEARCEGGRVEQVSLTNLPAYTVALDVALDVPGLGRVAVDVAYGGAFFAIVDAAALGFALVPAEASALVAAGCAIRDAAHARIATAHPDDPRIAGITFTLFAGPWDGPGCISRNAVIVAPGRVDRSPCGTGSSARMAALHARGRLGVGQGFTHESLIGTRFEVAIAAPATVGPYPAVVTTIAGRAWITGVFQHLLDPDDPFAEGFTLPDLWGPRP